MRSYFATLLEYACGLKFDFVQLKNALDANEGKTMCIPMDNFLKLVNDGGNHDWSTTACANVSAICIMSDVFGEWRPDGTERSNIMGSTPVHLVHHFSESKLVRP